jgi:hypothetical protein
MSAPQRLEGRATTPGRTALALQAFERGAFELVASELARCRIDRDPLTQLRLASEMESIARTVLDLGELLVRFELADPLAPAAVLGQNLLDQLDGTLTQLRKRVDLGTETERADPSAPPEPNAPLDEIESFLASRVAPSVPFLRAPFGASGRELRLVERNRHGHDIWWGGCFFAIPHGRSPHLVFRLIRVLVAAREIRSQIRSWMQAPHTRWLSRSRTTRPDAQDHPVRVLRLPLLRVSVTLTGLEMQQHIAGRKRKTTRAF